MFVEFVVAAAVGTLFFAWESQFGGFAAISGALRANLAVFYAAVATIFGALLGFAVATVTIAAGLLDSATKRMDYIRTRGELPQIWSVFIGVIRRLGIATTIALVALIIDRDDPLVTAQGLTLFRAILVVVGMMTVLRLRTAIWVLANLAGIASMSDEQVDELYLAVPSTIRTTGSYQRR